MLIWKNLCEYTFSDHFTVKLFYSPKARRRRRIIRVTNTSLVFFFKVIFFRNSKTCAISYVNIATNKKRQTDEIKREKWNEKRAEFWKQIRKSEHELKKKKAKKNWKRAAQLKPIVFKDPFVVVKIAQTKKIIHSIYLNQTTKHLTPKSIENKLFTQ